MSAPMQSRARGHAVLVVAAGVSAAMHVAKLPPAIHVLQQQLPLSLTQAGFLLSLVQLAGMSLGALLGAVAGQWGLRRSMMAGLLTLALASLLGALAQEVGMLMALRALEGFGLLLSTLPAPGLLRRLMPAPQLGPALGFWGCYMPLGTALSLLCGPWVMQHFDWPLWWVLLGSLSLLMAVLLYLGLPSDVHDAPPQGLEQDPGQGRLVRGFVQALVRTLSLPSAWLLAACFAVYSAQWLAVVGFLPTLYSQAGVALERTAALTALVAAANIGGNLASAWCLQRGIRPERLLYAGFLTMMLGAALAFSTASGPGSLSRYAGALLFSLVGGVIPGTLFALTVRLIPQTALLATAVGWVQQWSALGQFTGPPLVAWVAQRSGGWQNTPWVTGAMAGLGLLLAFGLGRLWRAAPTVSARAEQNAC